MQLQKQRRAAAVERKQLIFRPIGSCCSRDVRSARPRLIGRETDNGVGTLHAMWLSGAGEEGEEESIPELLQL